jgi:flagellar assembly protein FliH
MSSSADHRAPRVGIIRGARTTDRTVIADVRRNLPVEVLDPIAIEAMRHDAQQEGFEQGYADGMARAQAEATAARAQLDQQFMSAMTALMGAANQLRSREASSLHHVADQAAGLALQIAEQVIARELAAATDPGRDAIARAMALAPEDGDIRIHLHPDDLTALGPVEDLAPGRSIALVPDASVQSGGCLLHVGAARIDAQIPAALARIAELLVSEVPS